MMKTGSLLPRIGLIAGAALIGVHASAAISVGGDFDAPPAEVF